EKLDQLILRHDEGSRVTVADILAYLQVLFAYIFVFVFNVLILQNEIGYGGEDTSMSPIPHLAHQYPQSSLQFRSTNIHNSSMVGTAAVGLARTGHCEETKNTVFSNALSSPVRRSLESYHPTQGRASHDNALPPENTNRNHGSNHLDQSQDSRTSSDSSMDMHSDRADLFADPDDMSVATTQFPDHSIFTCQVYVVGREAANKN
ncbi:hypothetical protein BHE74_00022771, partial [Ensete ventricosum]